MTKIIRLEASNIKRLTAVEITPEGHVVIIGGDNAAGKSSVLDSIMYALAGKGSVPAEPIHKGERKASAVVDLDNGLRIARTFSAKGSTLTVTDSDGKMSSPQRVLDRLCGAIAFDPLSYSRQDSRKQAKMLSELVGLDTTVLDQERAGLYEDRTMEKRDLKQLEARLESMPRHVRVPAAEQSMASLLAELEKRQGILRENESLRDKAADAAADVRSFEQYVSEMSRALRDAVAGLKKAKRRLQDAEDVHASEQEAAAAAVDPDIEEVRKQLETVEADNAKVRDKRAREELLVEIKTMMDGVEELNESILGIDEKKRTLLEEAKFPVPGLGFDADGVTFDGVPLEQASQAERLRVSVAMGLAMNPDLRVLLVRDASLLDDESMLLMAQMAERADAQLWLERVGDGDEGAVIIEDGMVRGVNR